MAGFFRQLAEQVLQPAPQLHSAAALPFARLPFASAAEAPIEATGDARPDTRHVDEGGNPVFSERSRAITPLTRITTERTKTRTEQNPSIAKGKNESLPVRRAVKSPLLKSARPLVRPRRRPTLKALAVAKRDPAAAAAGERKSSHHAPATSKTKSPPRRPTVVAKRTLRPPVRPKPAAQRNVVAPATPEVHIHIGRIELTAAPVAAPKRESAPMTKPMSLAEYLRQKAGGEGERA